ncbi:pilus assembly protein [Devosia pacifica]|uniref:Pilus assembly protein n=1 Tax=Devosia pacifica TaxID=1335967 RepID=A0A918SBL3_9HYPH|nr:pilus assembly protein [Devosia pacifica]
MARDPATGAFGVATATGGPVVGSLVPHARAGVGAIATQGYTNGLYGFDGLDLLSGGQPAETVLSILTDADAGRQRRQCLVMDRDGSTAAWSGDGLTPYAGSLSSRDVAVAGNLLVGPQVLQAMLDAYQAMDAPIEDKLLAALVAADAKGGDSRGTRSAALKVYTSEPYPAIDIRVDWSDTPIADLEPILDRVRAPDYASFFKRVPTRADPGRM